MNTATIRAEQKRVMGLEHLWTYAIKHPHFGWLTIDNKSWASREEAKTAASGSAYPTKIVRV